MKQIKTLYNPNTDLGRAKNEALSEKIENAKSVLTPKCCALILECKDHKSFFLHLLDETEEHPEPVEKTFTMPGIGSFVIAAIIYS